LCARVAGDQRKGFTSIAHLLLSEVTQLAPVTVGVGRQPAKYKPYFSALLKVRHQCAPLQERLRATQHLQGQQTRTATLKDFAAA
jgi:hypothetical protein